MYEHFSIGGQVWGGDRENKGNGKWEGLQCRKLSGRFKVDNSKYNCIAIQRFSGQNYAAKSWNKRL